MRFNIDSLKKYFLGETKLPNHSLAEAFDTDYSQMQHRLLIAARKKAGSWAELCRELPVSQSHLSLLKNGHNKMGAVLMLRLMDYIDIFPELEGLIDDVLDEGGAESRN